ncbi:hypothetical protein ACFH04_00780 [Streptomyces noboritoensis]|uniref:Uncharacterized protein n=1 Tax=Streptomyces noboritoensis TaxID=67337 RepID=A0ABV6T926_9ACTN
MAAGRFARVEPRRRTRHLVLGLLVDELSPAAVPLHAWARFGR